MSWSQWFPVGETVRPWSSDDLHASFDRCLHPNLRLRLQLERETSTRLFVRQTVNLSPLAVEVEEMAGLAFETVIFYEKFRRSSTNFEKSGINYQFLYHPGIPDFLLTAYTLLFYASINPKLFLRTKSRTRAQCPGKKDLSKEKKPQLFCLG